MSKEQAKKLVKIYFNDSTVEKALKLDWPSCGTRVSLLLTQMNEFDHSP